jgi:uncharacterized integral membrane protein
VDTQGGTAGKRPVPWRLIAFGALALYAVLLVILNANEVKVNFVFFSTRASLVVVLLLAMALGFLAGFLFDTLRERRKRSTPS